MATTTQERMPGKHRGIGCPFGCCNCDERDGKRNIRRRAKRRSDRAFRRDLARGNA